PLRLGAERAVAAIGGRHDDDELVFSSRWRESGASHEGGVILAAAVEQIDHRIAPLRGVVGLRQEDGKDAVAPGRGGHANRPCLSLGINRAYEDSDNSQESGENSHFRAPRYPTPTTFRPLPLDYDTQRHRGHSGILSTPLNHYAPNTRS